MNNSEDKAKQLFEESIALYHTIDCGDDVKEWESPEKELEKILKGEKPLFSSDLSLPSHLALLTLIGYQNVGVKYLDKITDNKNISARIIEGLISRLNEVSEVLSEVSKNINKSKLDKNKLNGISKN